MNGRFFRKSKRVKNVVAFLYTPYNLHNTYVQLSTSKRKRKEKVFQKTEHLSTCFPQWMKCVNQRFPQMQASQTVPTFCQHTLIHTFTQASLFPLKIYLRVFKVTRARDAICSRMCTCTIMSVEYSAKLEIWCIILEERLLPG